MRIKTTTISLGDIALNKGYLTKEDLEEAILIKSTASKKKRLSTLGSVLVNCGFLSSSQLETLEDEYKNILTGEFQKDLPAEVIEALRTPANRFGKFVRMELIGRGGLGEVWKAYDLVLNRIVAIKFVKSIRDDHWKMFMREAELLGKLQHPNIVPMYELGDRFIVMPLIKGSTLDDAKLPFRESIKAIYNVAVAMHYAHQQGILHRDLKPSNILVERISDDKFHVWVTDFGIAKEIQSKETLQTTGMIMGTPAYMSPEQVRGQFGQVDHKSDIYSLGATLFQLAAGTFPYLQDDIYKLMKSIVEEEIAVPSNVPKDIKAIIEKAMEKRQSARYESALEFAQDIERYLKDEPVFARPTGPIRRIARKISRFRAQTAVLALGMLLAAVLTFVIFKNDAVPIPIQPNSGNTIKTDKIVNEIPIADTTLLKDVSNLWGSEIKNLKDALKVANEIVLKRPKDPVGYLTRGRVFFEMKNFQEAKKDFEMCTSLSKKFIPVVSGYTDRIPGE